jgi:hypothetical protein
MSGTYLYKKGGMHMGPYPLEKMRSLARQGQVGRSHQISGDGGASWDSGAAYPEIFAPGEDGAVGKSTHSPPGLKHASQTEASNAMPTEAMWHYCSATAGQQGPVPESQIRQLISLGRIEPNDTVWTQTMGDTWVPAESIPKFSGLFPRASADDREDDSRDRQRRRKGGGARQISRRTSTQASFNGAGLSGFICSMVAVVLLALPCLVWVVVAESFFWMFNIIIPFTILAIVGLVLSVIGLRKLPRGMATTGTVLGVIALMLGIMAIVGWFMLPYRLAIQRRTAIDSFATDIKLEQRNLAEELAAYRKITHEEGESDQSLEARRAIGRRRVGERFDSLVKAYENHVSATTKTAEFQTSFEELHTLSKKIEEVRQAAQAVEGMEMIDVLQTGNANVPALRVLMDTLSLYDRGEISLQQAEAKMTGR